MRRRMMFLLLLMAQTTQAANEIRAFCPGVTTAYALIREIDGDVWYPTGQVFEVWGTSARTAADYDIAMTDKSGDMFVGSFDTNISAGTYYVTVSNRVGASPADTDPVLWYDYADWSGSVFDIDNRADINTILADTNELQTDWTNGGRLDLLIDGIKAMTDLISINTTTVSDANDANSFTITAGADVNDAYLLNLIMVEDADDSHREIRWVYDYNDTRVVTVDEPFSFTPAVSDNVWIMGTGYGGYLYSLWKRLGLQIPVYYFNGRDNSDASNNNVYYFNDR